MRQVDEVVVAIGIVISAFLTREKHFFLDFIFHDRELLKLRQIRAIFLLFRLILKFGRHAVVHLIWANYLDAILIYEVS